MLTLGILETLVAGVAAGFGKALPESVVKAIYSAIANSQARKVWRRAIRDMAEDMVYEALVEHGIGPSSAKEYNKKKKGYYKQEARNRFDHALQERG